VSVPGGREASTGDNIPRPPKYTQSTCQVASQECDTINMYSVREETENESQPFKALIGLYTMETNIRMQTVGLFDDGAMIVAMSTPFYDKHACQLGELQPSRRKLLMADGTVVKPKGVWKGKVRVGSIEVEAQAEVFGTGQGWEFLVGKPLLRALSAIHEYARDTITVTDGNRTTHLSNLYTKLAAQPEQRKNRTETEVHKGTQEANEYPETEGSRESNRGVTIPPTREVPRSPNCNNSDTTNPNLIEIPVMTTGAQEPGGIYTRTTNPFKPERVAAVLASVRIGDDLTADQRTEVESTIATYADCFALAVSEVTVAEDAVHRLNIPSGTKFDLKRGYRRLSPPQKQYLNKKVDELKAAGIIEEISPTDVRYAAPVVLAKKAHSGMGLPLEELLHRLNDQLVAAGEPPLENLPTRPETKEMAQTKGEDEWRVCMDFKELNDLTEIAPMQQGDIREKQLRLSGHRWVSTFDFTSGFYAVALDEKAQPYVVFYVEGRGYFKFKRMPFGLTGAPSTFAEVTANHLGDMIAAEEMELFVDDGGQAGDEFEEMMRRLKKLLQRVRERKLSLSAKKTKLFQPEAVFAGATVSRKGVTPDTTKLTTVVDWPQPADGMELHSFLGLTGHYRDLIKDYAAKEAPLRDLVNEANARLPKRANKVEWRAVMKRFKLENRWTDTHTRAFLELKRMLTSEPVLRGPKFDGSPFIVTTDGCKEGFAGVLAQDFETVLSSGKTVCRRHPIAFASKRTSDAETRYKPFLLEFAALRFGLEKFADVTWGYPVKVETDCKALATHLLSNKLNATHARWREGVLAHQIVDVKHIPGRTNVVADTGSRVGEARDREEDGSDGSGWDVSEDWENMSGLVNDVMLVKSEMKALEERFATEPLFLEVLRALTVMDDGTDSKAMARARHRASEYFVEKGKLWRTKGGSKRRARTKLECVTREEAIGLAKAEHNNGGHWHRDAIKINLTDRIWSPGLDASIIAAIQDCAKCKGFGAAGTNALLEPITRRHPFELFVADYLKLPKGKGGHSTVLLILDTCSQHVWGFAFKKDGTGKTTVESLEHVATENLPPEVFMTDGGSHFDCKEVREFCESMGIKTIVTSAYSPWVNGLVEGTNKLLLHVLKRVCAPGLGEDEYDAMTVDKLPKTWPDHLQAAIQALNWRILPKLHYRPKELLWGLPLETPPTPIEIIAQEFTERDAVIQMAYAAQQRLDGYDSIVQHAAQRKTKFDKTIWKKRGGPSIFRKGELVQIYRSDLDNTLKTEKKLLPKWSKPCRVKERLVNAYKLEDLQGNEIKGTFSTRRLRPFIPRRGTQLWKEWEEQKTERERKEEDEDSDDADAVLFLWGEHGAGREQTP
jgi:transposase InsO family protein